MQETCDQLSTEIATEDVAAVCQAAPDLIWHTGWLEAFVATRNSSAFPKIAFETAEPDGFTQTETVKMDWFVPRTGKAPKMIPKNPKKTIPQTPQPPEFP